MRAAIFEDIKKIVYTEDYPKPTVSPDYAIVKVSYCGICGSDVSNYKNKNYQTPIIMGHEFSGVITEIGENIDKSYFTIGEKVIGVNPVLDLGKGELRSMGIFKDGGFAEFVKVYKDYLFKIPEFVSFEEAAMIESFAVATRALNKAKIPENQKILIIGGGNIGLTTLSVLRAVRNPHYVLVVEPHEYLRGKAIELGATDALPSSKAKIRKFFKKNGGTPDYIFDCVGNEQTVIMAIDFIKNSGNIVLEGIYRGNISFPISMMILKEISLHGTWGHDREDIIAAIDLVAKKIVEPNKLISKIIPLKDIQSGFEEYLKPGERKFVKILVKI